MKLGKNEESRRSGSMKPNRLSEYFLKAKSPEGYYESYCEYITELMESLDFNDITKVTDCFLNAR